MLLTNCLLASGDGLSAEDALRAENAADDLVRCARSTDARVIIVSNEVGLGIVPDNPLARVFRDVAGRANQRVAAAADRVIFIMAGIAMPVKP
jgi:adenosylcobinamide kinase/adenosylcobinamide-phosphate guanylyltransferase